MLISPRLVDIAERVCSVMLAILIAHLCGGANTSWAAFAGYMVLSGSAANTLMRGAFRLVGTVAGGLLALLLSPWIAGSTGLSAAAMLAVTCACLYGATTSRRAYAWLFFGLTFAMATLDHLANPGLSIGAFVETRLVESAAGISACVLVSLLSSMSLRRGRPAAPPPPPAAGGWHPAALRHALLGAAAAALLTIATGAFNLPGPTQAAVTIIASMLIPLGALSRTALMPVSTRLLHRLLGCLLGGFYAGASLLLFHGSAALLLAATALGVTIGRAIETGDDRWRYVGTQFALAMLVTLVPDDYAHAATTPAWDRLAGIFIGIAFLLPVLLAAQIVLRRPALQADRAAIPDSLDATE